MARYCVPSAYLLVIEIERTSFTSLALLSKKCRFGSGNSNYRRIRSSTPKTLCGNVAYFHVVALVLQRVNRYRDSEDKSVKIILDF